MTRYDQDYVKNEVDKALKDINSLYNAGCINWSGTIKRSEVTYTEFISNILLENICMIKDKIVKVDRAGNNKSYRVDSHHKKDGNIIKDTNRVEENTAKKMFNHSNDYNKIGRILDYQVPLKGKGVDKAGKIDLISYNKDTNELFLLELKRADSKETMLRAALEAYTYSKQVDEDALFKDFEIKTNPQVIVAPLVYKDGFAHMQYKFDESLVKLMNELEIYPYFIEEIKDIEKDYECKIYDSNCELNFNNNPYMSYIDKISNLSSGLGKKGSKYWMGMLVNTRMKDTFDAVINANIDWISPLKDEAYTEYRVSNSKCIEKLDEYIPDIKKYDKKIWSKNGPLWDGIGIGKSMHEDKLADTLYLVEAKAHTKELSSKCAAKGPEVGGSLVSISKSLENTYNAMGGKGEFDLWTDGYYQLANRLTYVKELNKLLNSKNDKIKKVKLLLINFTNDYTNIKTSKIDFITEYIDVQTKMFGNSNALDIDPDVEIIYFSVIPS